MHAHPSDRFIRDSGATIMATGYMYARLRSSFIIASGWYAPRAHHRGGFFDHYDRVRRDLEDRCTRLPASPSSNEYRGWISRATLPDLSPRLIFPRIRRNGTRSCSGGLFRKFCGEARSNFLPSKKKEKRNFSSSFSLRCVASNAAGSSRSIPAWPCK